MKSSSKQATQAVQDDILRNVTRVEGSVLKAVTSASDTLQDDIKSLAEQLDNMNLESVQQTVARFTASNHDLLEHLSNRLDSIFALHTDFRALSDETQMAAARQNILDSLHFPQIRERRNQIPKAHNETFQWILEPGEGKPQRWDDFTTWLRASSSESRIYWIHGKIGAGKTTLLRFLDDNLNLYDHMIPWAKESTIVRGTCFFWSAGNNLQKSMTGLLRTLLTQLFEQTPDLIPRVVQPRKWQIARLPGNHVIDWTESELQDCLREHILYATKSRMVFLLIDGLDEFEGADEAREDLIDLLVASAAHENVKICLSSRPWNIFRDAFGSYPQLKVEDLTYDDIGLYVRDQLHSNKRFHKLMQYDPSTAEALVGSLISKAAGVFLWVRLVVKQLLKGLRDGDGIRTLRKKVEEIPADLDEFFMRLVDSIEPQNRKEASELLQLALYQEKYFTTLHSNCLLDISFIEEGKPDFALDPFYDFSGLDFSDPATVAFRLESTMRKLNSRSMGLLEIQGEADLNFQTGSFEDDSDDETSITTGFGNLRNDKGSVPVDNPKMLDESKVLTTAWLPINFLHRSLRDFLLTSKVQTLLHQHTQGPYDVRMFFRNARLVQLVALNKAEIYIDGAVGLASYILSTLTVPRFRDNPRAADVATVMRPAIENLVQFERTERISGWYISCVLQSWHEEDSTFLTLALDFGLESYLRAHLTLQSFRSKTGRPILDYVLRPRFAKKYSAMCVGNQLPDSAILNTVLGLGADPNQRYHDVSIWALFLCFVADHFEGDMLVGTSVQGVAYFEAMMIMIQHGADLLLPRAWLADPGYFEAYSGDDFYDETSEERFWRRFRNTAPAIQGDEMKDALYAVGDLLEHFRDYFGSRVDTLKALVMQREVHWQGLTPGPFS